MVFMWLLNHEEHEGHEGDAAFFWYVILCCSVIPAHFLAGIQPSVADKLDSRVRGNDASV